MAREIILVTGGVKSGKSAFALKLAEPYSNARKIFIATAQCFDDEMREKRRKHQQERNEHHLQWETIEETTGKPLDIAEIIASFDKKEQEKNGEAVLVVDCLILWLNNLLLESTEEEIMHAVTKLQQALQKTATRVIMVTNELGMGIIPMHKTARLFLRLAGECNKRMAEEADKVYLMVSSIPVLIKKPQ